MLKSISIKNFQSHKDTYIEFDSGMNVIIGPTNSGKSVVFKALNWVVNGKPSGDEFCSKWGGKTSVQVMLDEYIITREKHNRENKYTLEHNNKKYDYMAFGQKVPEEIQKVFNFLPVNIQSQLDPPFLLSNSSGEVSRYLNKIVDLDDIDVSLSNISKLVKKEKQEIDHNETQQINLQEELKEYSWVDSTEIELEKLEFIEDEVKLFVEQNRLINNILNKILSIKKKIQYSRNFLQYRNKISELSLLEDNLIELKKEQVCLGGKIKQINSINLIEFVDVDIYEGKINGLLHAENELFDLEKQRCKLLGINNLINNIKLGVLQKGNKVKYLEKKYKESFPEICPLCGNV